MRYERKIPVNFYILKECNYSCKICFSQFEDRKKLSYKEHLNIIDKLIGYVDKITFVGGEPLLYPKLFDLIKYSKSKGFITSIVTNGSKLTEKFLKESKDYLDWIAISIDSLNTKTNIEMGRGNSNNQVDFVKIINLLKKYQYNFKINTVVSKQNYKEDLSQFIKSSKPNRWKIFQALILKNINDKNREEIEIEKKYFDYFLKCNHINDIDLIGENNDDMLCSYYMIDPYGRLFSNKDCEITYTESLLKIDLPEALKKLETSLKKLEERDGFYYKNI